MVTSAELSEAEAGFRAARKALFDPFRIGLFVDPRGAYTTAAALVAKVEALLKTVGASGGLDGRSVAILGGTGGVGRAAAGMAAASGARVTLVSREALRATTAAEEVAALFGGTVAPKGAAGEPERGAIAAPAEVGSAAGAAGATLLGEASMRALRGPKVFADVNAVPPAGLAGVEAGADGASIGPGLYALGALAIGDLKFKVEAALLRDLLGDGPAPAIDAGAARARAAALLAGG
jgi:methylene-tetrahydromethanopterin dehydrogenase